MSCDGAAFHGTLAQEYISVGKGRDMGFDSINSFESKVSRLGGFGRQEWRVVGIALSGGWVMSSAGA